MTRVNVPDPVLELVISYLIFSLVPPGNNPFEFAADAAEF